MADGVTSITMGPLACRPQGSRGTKGGKHYWKIVIRGRGGRTLEAGWMTQQEAEQAAARWIAAGLPKEDEKKDKPTTMGEVLSLYAGTYKGSKRHAKSTLDNLKRVIKHLKRHLEDVPLDRVNAETVAMYVSARDKEGAATGTIVKEHTVWASCWNYAVGSGWVAGGLPDCGVKVRPTYNDHTPSVEDIEKVHKWLRDVDGIKQDGTPRRGRAEWPPISVLIASTTGMRVGEIEALRWRDIDSKRGKLTTRQHEESDLVKTPRTIPMPGRLKTALKEWYIRQGSPGPDDHVLGCTPGILRSRGREKLVKACDALEIDRFTWHGIRRRVVRRYRRAGVPGGEAAALLATPPWSGSASTTRLSPEIWSRRSPCSTSWTPPQPDPPRGEETQGPASHIGRQGLLRCGNVGLRSTGAERPICGNRCGNRGNDRERKSRFYRQVWQQGFRPPPLRNTGTTLCFGHITSNRANAITNWPRPLVLLRSSVA